MMRGPLKGEGYGKKRTAKVPPPAKQAAVESNVKCSCFCIVILKSNRKQTKS